MTSPHHDRDTCVETEHEIRRDLVETLFGTVASFIAGLFGGLMAPISAWLMTRDSVYLWLAAILLCVGTFRTALMLAHNAAKIETRRENMQRWENLYAIGAVAFMFIIGITAAMLLRNERDHVANYYGIVILMGCAGALGARNAGSPVIVFWQMICLFTPFTISALMHKDPRYWGLTLCVILVMVSIKSTTKFLHGNLESALRNGYDARTQRRRFGLALNSMSHGLCMGNIDRTISVVNHRMMEFFGISADPTSLEALVEAIGARSRMEPKEIAAFADTWKMHAALGQKSVFSEKIGARIFDFRCEPADAGGFVTVVEDVTEARMAAQEIERIARFDSLTGLPNRYQFLTQLESDLQQLDRMGGALTLLNIDLDHFKEVNDTLGHLVGDHLLLEVAARLQDCAPAGSMVARFGGDEFCVLLRSSHERADAEAVAAKIIEEIEQPCEIDGNTIYIGASVGLAVAPDDANNTEGMLKSSDLAMYRSKLNGRGQAVWFTKDLESELLKKRRTESELQHALKAGEFVVFYQPIIDVRSGEVICCEALLRWRHPTRGLVAPLDFIPIAEETGLIVKIGAWVLERACTDAAAWPSHIRVAVNVSPKQFQQKNLFESLTHALKQSGLDASRLELEITESTLMDNSIDVESKVAELMRLGLRLSLDDFGTGYSSLGYLNRFPVKKVKIDQSFTRQMIESSKMRAIIAAVASLTRELEIEMVVEGVDTHAQLAFLATKNIYLIQGFLFSPPLPLEEIAPRLGCWSRQMALEKIA